MPLREALSKALVIPASTSRSHIPETYVHRIGRTGRAGNEGMAISFCSKDELPYLKDIEKLIRMKIKVIEGHPYPYPEPGTKTDKPEEQKKPDLRNKNKNKGNGQGQNKSRKSEASKKNKRRWY